MFSRMFIRVAPVAHVLGVDHLATRAVIPCHTTLNPRNAARHGYF
jgi:hypothetical protein